MFTHLQLYGPETCDLEKSMCLTAVTLKKGQGHPFQNLETYGNEAGYQTSKLLHPYLQRYGLGTNVRILTAVTLKSRSRSTISKHYLRRIAMKLDAKFHNTCTHSCKDMVQKL